MSTIRGSHLDLTIDVDEATVLYLERAYPNKLPRADEVLGNLPFVLGQKLGQQEVISHLKGLLEGQNNEE